MSGKEKCLRCLTNEKKIPELSESNPIVALRCLQTNTPYIQLFYISFFASINVIYSLLTFYNVYLDPDGSTFITGFQIIQIAVINSSPASL